MAPRKSAVITRKNTPAPRHSGLRWLSYLAAGLLGIYILMFLLLPFFSLRYAEQWYSEQGEGYALLINGWTLSPFTGEIQLRDVEASYPSAEGRASVGADFVGVNVNLSALFDKTIHVQSVGIRGLRFRGVQSDDGLTLAGVSLPENEASEPAQETPDNEAGTALPAGWSLRVDDIDLEDNLVHWQQQGLSLSVELTEFGTGLFDSASDKATPLSLDVTLRELSVDAGDDRIILNQPVTLTLTGEAATLLTHPAVSGDISLSELRIKVPGTDEVQLGALTLQQARFAMADDGMTSGFASLALQNIRAQLPAEEQAQLDQLLLTSLRWQSATDSVSIGDIGLQGFSGALAGFPSLGLAEFNARDIRVSDLSVRPEAEVGTADLKELRAVHPQAGRLTLGAFAVSGIQANEGEQNVAALTLDRLEVLPVEGEVPLASLAHYEVTDIHATPQSFSSGLHRLYGLVANVTRQQDGNIKGVPVVAAEDGVSASAVTGDEVADGQDVTAPEESAPAFLVEIAGVELMEGEVNSVVHWTDETTSPVVRTDARILELNTGPVSTAELDKGVEMNMVMALDAYNRIRVSGTMGQKGDYPEGSMTLTVEQLNLVDFNPYVEQAMGYRVRKGMLGVDSDISITDGQLGGKLVIRLQNSKFEPADEATINRLSKQISMPVETALSVLKDDNNNIRIEVPLSGDISDPDVGINDVIDQLSRKALKTATLYYLRQSLVPYGQFISIASFASDQLFAIRLNDLNFDPQVTGLTDKHKEYLDTVARMMSSKTELELQVCPVAGPQETEAWGDQWSTEVYKRAAEVKAYLAGVKDRDDRTLSGRITLCSPKKGDKPQVILGV